jgi:hypothetical protein
VTVKRGFYRHYKGPVYFVEGVGTLHDDTRRVVVYQSTQSAEDGEPRLRFEDDFEAWVDRETGGPCSPAALRRVRRFARIESPPATGEVPR